MMVLGIQKSVIDQVLHANVLQRINDSAYYGNEYSLNEVMNNLTAAIFVADKNATTLSQSLQANRVRFSLE
ncbi:zinc-dependent metalloprotease [Pseudoalteromonas piscicida]|uniref:zinc-dependent metalloprotease n=1 Tax=Pseudoalteromonas piscicida TaxID=43662 RepID=UPI0027383866|nr:zinc-dependent metalloprotease [Pseudoalteromonas piscicida]MDP4490080.1 zinc-dependent metalloprotease [Pseudoalteromonas piscicida]WMO15424.1 zinc-dependent metalloprotease [Pseudoalteromonas piscicida]